MNTNPRKKLLTQDNLVQIIGLIVSIVVVGFVYSTIIRPNAAEAELEQKVMAAQEDGVYVPERNIYVILKNAEQQICFTLLMWAMIIVCFKFYQVNREKNALNETYLDVERGERILPGESLVYAKQIQARIDHEPTLRDKMLPRLILSSLHRFHSTSSIQDVAQSVRDLADTENDKMDSDLSLTRYIAWAIPSVGFLGTVRGIGEALGMAEQAIQGDISGVTAALGLAFNSTLVALLLSIILMFFIHILQSRQETLIHDIEEYCRNNLVSIMKIPTHEESEELSVI